MGIFCAFIINIENNSTGCTYLFLLLNKVRDFSFVISILIIIIIVVVDHTEIFQIVYAY